MSTILYWSKKVITSLDKKSQFLTNESSFRPIEWKKFQLLNLCQICSHYNSISIGKQHLNLGLAESLVFEQSNKPIVSVHTH